MKKSIKNFVAEADRALREMKKYLPVFVCCFLFSIVVYYMLLSHQLVNSNDGIWEYSYYKAGKWSLSLGRWFLLYLDRLHFGISTDPLTSLTVLAFYCAGFVFLLDIFEMGKRKTGCFAAMLFLTSIAVSSSLTYRYTSHSFGLAFLLSMLAAWVLAKLNNAVWAVVLSGILIALVMGLYQAHLNCVCIVLLGYYLDMFNRKNTDLRGIFRKIRNSFGGIIVGGVLYVAVLKAHLAFFYLQLSDYNGANRYSLWNSIRNFEGSMRRTYREFGRYFMEEICLLDIFWTLPVLPAALGIMALLLIGAFWRLFKTDKRKAALYPALIFLIPPACNAVLMIATVADVSVLMTAGLALCVPVLLCVTANLEFSDNFFPNVRKCTYLLLGIMLYGSVYQLQTDQYAMLEGQTAAATMARDIVHELGEEELLDADLEYCVVGVAGYNDLFEKSKIYEGSNMYARFGIWYNEPSCTRRTWQGIFSYLCGMNLTMCSSVDYSMIYGNEIVRDMPVYPNDGYIAKVGDIVVVKVADAP